ncbi:SDR family oxidoreductase [Lysinibacillus odysseyi]|uniref:Nmra-like family protein n=1 Tax=Lysinibacillus odysseyi 34hs-1 = NBRC 100172 TaxID=1220589 RepID=A0A0A3INC9_9BACI|nr:SDR family oxidoreductase [Lysinibacillus odysseyi]KGR84313.1 nmra-like family protein [Lysinibacillus odysseyi 34hs-1 = NBRC 100172]
MKILVTGSTGQLGSALLKQLKDLDYQVKITSRRKPEGVDFTWVYSNLLTGEGLEEAVKDVDVIIHAATSPVKSSENIEVAGFEKLLSKLDHLKLFIYPSIVGIEEIPFKYYRLKYKAEELLKNSSVPYTIARASQFHSFVDSLLLSKSFFKRYIIPGRVKFQSVDVNDFAKHLIDLVNKGPQGKLDDFCGPDIMTLREMAELKIKINNEANTVLSIALPGKLYNSLVEGKNTNPLQRKGIITYEEHLRNKLDQR